MAQKPRGGLAQKLLEMDPEDVRSEAGQDKRRRE